MFEESGGRYRCNSKNLIMQGESKWGSLVPLNNTQPLPTYSLSHPVVMIGRAPDCHIVINDKRLSGKHCTITQHPTHAVITDLSTNGSFIGEQRIGKGSTAEVKHMGEMWLLTASKVPPLETIGFRVQIEAVKIKEAQQEEERKRAQEEKQRMEKEEEQKRREKEQQRRREEQQKRRQEEQKRRQEEQTRRKKQQAARDSIAEKLKQGFTCPFCFQIMTTPVLVQPCNHRFCGGCLTELVNHKKEQCIQCRKIITTASRDAAFNSLIEEYLRLHPEEKKDPNIETALKEKNIFGHEPLNVYERIHGAPEKKKVEAPPPPPRGRRRVVAPPSSSSSSSSDSEEEVRVGQGECLQCRAARNGFRCPRGQAHIACHTCGKHMPQRDDPALKQSCHICTTYYCNLYLPPCRAGGTKLSLIQDRKAGVRIDADMLRGNRVQFQILRDYLRSKKLGSREVFDHMVQQMHKGNFSYLIDRKIMRIPPLVPKEIKLNGNEAVCDLCWPDLWFQMVFAYRIEFAAFLPFAARHRPACYYGFNCRTMDHNRDHAKKYNHWLHQAKFD